EKELEFAAWAENFNYRIPDYQQTLDIPTAAITMLGNQLKTYHDAELKIERGDTSKAAILLRNDAHKKLEANNE
ncbi:MAG: hypothetical protein LBR28_02315, partial [Bacteroidales bacterium]|nr:hypothetical protein [Bacteroidales bacterium]